MDTDVAVLGIFVADLAFKAQRMPLIGETLLGENFAMGPGGKGSNQAIAAARAGARTVMITRIGQDQFGVMAREIWQRDKVDTAQVIADETASTGAAFIFVSSATGDNAIIVESGAAARLGPRDVLAAEHRIAASRVFVTQFEQPVDAAVEGLKVARRHGVTTVLNPAPAVTVDDSIYALCDYVVPNETEAATLSGIDTGTDEGVRRAAESFVARGARNALITLGGRGAFLFGEAGSHRVPAFMVDTVVDTAGAGDAFTGGFAAALAEGRPPVEAVNFAMATAALSIQKPGTAPAMPQRHEIDAFLNARAPMSARA